MAAEATADYASLPFDEAIAFFRGKLDLPTEHWSDLWQGAHDRAFVVAGATQADLLADLRAAVDQAITAGTTLEDFRAGFPALVAKHGWTGWTGSDSAAGTAWRARTIYETNVRTAYAAGRYRQMREPEALARRPYGLYRHSDSVVHPRPLHVSWDGLVLPLTDPWCDTHTTPNGWGCKCQIYAVGERDLARLGKTAPDTAPDDGTYTWKHPLTGDTVTVPNGIDPGWGYAPGQAAASGRNVELLADKLLRWQGEIGAQAWARLYAGVLPELRTQFAAWVDTVRTRGRAENRHRLAGALLPDVLGYLAKIGREPASAGIVVEDRLLVGRKAERHGAAGDALSAADWAQVPDALARPAAVYWDAQDERLLYLLPAEGAGPKQPRLVVALDYREKKAGTINSVRTAYLIDATVLAREPRYDRVL